MVTQAIEATAAKRHTPRRLLLLGILLASMIGLLFVSTSSHAAGTVTATGQCSSAQTAAFQTQCAGYGTYFANLEAACVAQSGSHFYCGYYPLPSQMRSTPVGLECIVTWIRSPSGLESSIPSATAAVSVLNCPLTCPAHASNMGGGSCICDANYKPDAAGRICESDCPIPALTNPPFQDGCSQALEDASSTQAQKDAACGTITPAMASAQQCLSNAITAKGIPFKVTSQVRGLEYQAHFKEIWDKMEKLAADPELQTPAMQTACATRRAEIAAEKGCDNAGPCAACTATGRNHCLKQGPAKPTSAAQHANRNAIDVSAAQTIKPLQTYLNGLRPPQTITQLIAAQNCPITCATTPPTSGSLVWGGTFKARDPVHFTTTCP